MTPQPQLIKHDPENGRLGDCYRTCIASILDLHPSEVPHFYSDTSAADQREQSREWFARHGLGIACFYYSAEGNELAAVLHTTHALSPGIPMILSGRSSLGVNHCVVIMDGAIISDPSGNGIVGPCDDENWWIELITVGADWQARGIKRRDGVGQLDQMSEDERRRWDDGRLDWRESDWQDHCGKPDCEQCDKEHVA